MLAALGALGGKDLPDLATASTFLAGRPNAAPALLDYVTLPFRRAPLDLRIEDLAVAHGIRVSSRSEVVLPGSKQQPGDAGLLIVHLAYGQEAPGRYGSWGWNALSPATYSTGGHSVVLAGLDGAGWTVLDPNRPGLQNWPHPGIATARTRLKVV